jgi:signal recognition particle subunit SEC65
MSHARPTGKLNWGAQIEEVSDSDSDPSEGDISELEDDFDEREILKARPSTSKAQASSSSALIDPSAIPSSQKVQSSPLTDGTGFQTAIDESRYKNFQCLYPVYFDKKRSRAEGRRVGLEDAVDSPLAREIVEACGRLRLETLFEPAKIHPKDWSNPGRIKVRIKGSGNPLVNNSEFTFEADLVDDGADNSRTSPLHACCEAFKRKSYNGDFCDESQGSWCTGSRSWQAIPKTCRTSGLEDEQHSTVLQSGSYGRWSQ